MIAYGPVSKTVLPVEEQWESWYAEGVAWRDAAWLGPIIPLVDRFGSKWERLGGNRQAARRLPPATPWTARRPRDGGGNPPPVT